MPTIAAHAPTSTRSASPSCTRATSSATPENFLRMCFAVPAEDYKLNPVLAKAMDRIFILHADHEQNASTSTVRLAGSSAPTRSPASRPASPACGARRHGGANEAALKMLRRSARSTASRSTSQGVKDKNAIRLMGFGHRVYKNYDPRATVMQKTCHEVLAEVGHGDDPLLKVAMELEKIALSDAYFIERKLYPNVDFYSGHHPAAMGFPPDDVHRAVRPGAHRRLDRPVEGDDRGSGARRSAVRARSTRARRAATTSPIGQARLSTRRSSNDTRSPPSKRASLLLGRFGFRPATFSAPPLRRPPMGRVRPCPSSPEQALCAVDLAVSVARGRPGVGHLLWPGPARCGRSCTSSGARHIGLRTPMLNRVM